MFVDQAQKLAILAAQETRERIREDRRKVSAQLVVQLLEYIEEHFLGLDFNVDALWNAFDIHDPAKSALFIRELGSSPNVYITEARMEVGARLLVSTTLTPWRIASAVGYSSSSSFGRAFQRWSKQSPTDYRKRPRKRVAAAEVVSQELLNDDELKAAMAGEVEPGFAERMLHRLDAIRGNLLAAYPQFRTPVPAAQPVLGVQLAERSMALAVWERIRGLPYDQQRSVVLGQVAFSTPALYVLLWQELQEIDRGELAARLDLARLARDCLEPIAASLGRQLPNFRARAWLTIAAAKTAAGDPAGAEQAFGIADEHLWVAGDDRDPWLVSTFRMKLSTLRLSEGKTEEASDLLMKAMKMVLAIVENTGMELPETEAAEMREMIAQHEARKQLVASSAEDEEGGDGDRVPHPSGGD